MESVTIDGIEYRFFSTNLAVSRCGKVLRKTEPFAPKVRADGYLDVCGYLAHRLVALLWLDNPAGAKLVHHKDHNKANNRADNLQWVTPQEHLGEMHHRPRGKHNMTEAGRASLRAFRTGFKDTPEVRARKREILDAVCPKRPCEVDGTIYRSIRQASIALNIHISTVRQRCFSKNFPHYKLL